MYSSVNRSYFNSTHLISLTAPPTAITTSSDTPTLPTFTYIPPDIKPNKVSTTEESATVLTTAVSSTKKACKHVYTVKVWRHNHDDATAVEYTKGNATVHIYKWTMKDGHYVKNITVGTISSEDFLFEGWTLPRKSV